MHNPKKRVSFFENGEIREKLSILRWTVRNIAAAIGN